MNKTNQDKIWELAASKIHDEADKTEATELKEMIQQENHKKVYRSVNEMHEKLKETAPLRHSSGSHSWEKVTQYFKQKQFRLYLNISKYAAILLLAFLLGTLINYQWKPAAKFPPAYNEIYVPLGQMSEITLSDGTHVWLNSGTTLKYPENFGSKSRDVMLTGEAFFKVTHSEIPFKVKIKNNEVEVLGTTFAAVAYPDENFSQVTLVEGKVQINDNTGHTLTQLKPRQQANLPDDSKEKITTKSVNTIFYESWVNGEIKFDNERLADVARRMERWYNVEIQFTSKEASDLKFTGTILKNKPIDQSMKAISLLLPIEVKYKNNLDIKDVITISKK